MTNNPMELLRAEHEIISGAEHVIRALDQVWQRDGEAYEKMLRDLIQFFRRYSDGFHHRKEEEVLFPALRKNQDFALPGLLDELEEHHCMFRDYVVAVETAIGQKKPELAQVELKRYCSQLLDHIAVENDELFVMTESLFDARDLENLYFKFKDIDLELSEQLKSDLEASLPRLSALL